MKIEIWSDFVCPFCYIGKRRLENALKQFHHRNQVKIELKSFELDPQAPVNDHRSTYEVLATKYGMSIEQAKQMTERVAEQAKSVGLTFHFDQMKRTNTFNAHRLAKYAEKLGEEKKLTEKLFYAHFTDGKNIGDPETLISLAVESGLDQNQVKELLEDKTAYAKEVRSDQEAARRYNITGVPYFIFNHKYAISGAQPLETFVSALEKVWKEETDGLKDLSSNSTQSALCTDENCEIPSN
ncbi:putative DsbA family dithiol-disulfide isomerase [Melghiribacillus thermohalophilus]|uniref:Putative DsbA family dithiol-disulfide isomerase n=1 Tax=Melghiribacillus thermohalophilus TaxID=1324956 RepID=A0A4R3MWI2_9BACI|nr:DsbA family oxidoreductase [Melghiribacillus thermohalophilus]TCT18264.1 putative DsbA family dithiol-disulfide isomerase [Melghiribacillus thermohalophilus]